MTSQEEIIRPSVWLGDLSGFEVVHDTGDNYHLFLFHRCGYYGDIARNGLEGSYLANIVNQAMAHRQAGCIKGE